jgi:hypothetical protein
MKNLSIVSLLMLLLVAYLTACQSLRSRPRPLHALIVTDSSEIGVSLRNNAYVAKIGFTFRNTTGHVISRAGCGGPGWPDVEKKVNDRWVAAYYPISLACRTIPDFSWEPGAKIRDQVSFMAFVRGHNTMPELEVDTIDGVYRLHWAFTEGRDVSAEKARLVEAVSNEFRMILRSSAASSNTR